MCPNPTCGKEQSHILKICVNIFSNILLNLLLLSAFPFSQGWPQHREGCPLPREGCSRKGILHNNYTKSKNDKTTYAVAFAAKASKL